MSDARIYQQKTVPEIVEQVLQEQGIMDYSLRLKDTRLPREYCVQYRETYLSFVERLLAEEGIFYFWEHSEAGTQFVMADLTQFGTPLKASPILELNNQSGGNLKGQFVQAFQWNETVRSTGLSQRDYSFIQPRYNQQQTVSRHREGGEHRDYELYNGYGRYKEDDSGQRFTQYSLEGLRNDASTGSGQSNGMHFGAGFRFTLAEHSALHLNRPYLLVGVTHHGQQPQALEEHAGSSATTYNNQFSVHAEAEYSWRPRKKYKPMVDGPQIAHVVGPPGEEIYTDEYGRVKLHFPWDRYSEENDKSSCWVRVAQNWAGGTWGHMAVPRIGHEVLVEFLEGDPDQPIVMGRTYHANNLPPYRLPQHKTRMTIKSRTHKGHGYNELRFEDIAGGEQVYMHGQMDYDQIMENDRREWIRNDRHLRVDHDKFEQVHNSSHSTIGLDKSDRIEQHRHFYAGGNFLWKVLGKVHRYIGGGLQLFVGAGRSTRIEASDETIIGGNQRTVVTNESYLNASKIVLESGETFTVKGPGGFITIDDAGVHIKGNVVNINSGGSPAAGTAPKPPQPDEPQVPTIPDDADHRGEY